ncbi:hypothetical protein BD289DRAFT_434192 [Coniella lustricola]|uniref:Uncharacterized protein n=1 Tax=Coniella lustricola TaxID=2025994 RepID=A0A2T3A7W5_9PEZI|nr:hypothetical protein BD289DRAFT_434192 [Coniella lustricola]
MVSQITPFFFLSVIITVIYLFHKGPRLSHVQKNIKQQSDTDKKTSKSIRLQKKNAERLRAYKDMYYKVQNLEKFPDILPAAKQMLQTQLEEGLLLARYKRGEHSILDIPSFDADALLQFMKNKQNEVGRAFEAYIQRREAGSGPELFQTFEEARQFLKNSTPLNYIDGAWLARIHQVTTPFALRDVTKYAWQIFSEELGDGDLEKNHIVLWHDLLRSVGIDLPAGDTLEFIDPSQGMNDDSVWRYALAQILISLFPNDFLPEILGMNMHYEAPAVMGCKANKEMPEFGISPYYYALHISIDNADSGHTAMAVGNIVNFMQVVRETGIMDYESAWKRIQAGYCLGESLDLTETVADLEDRLVDFLYRKSKVASKIHCTSRARIGKQSLSTWFAAYGPPGGDAGDEFPQDDCWKDDFLEALADSKPWVHRGDSSKSLLMRELSWKGRMFGAFTQDEALLTQVWIDSLNKKDADPKETYWARVGGFQSVEKAFIPPRRDVAVTHPVFPPTKEWSPSKSSTFIPRGPLQISQLRLDALLPLWFVHPCLMENIISAPYQTITPLVSKCLQLLRAEKGYQLEGSGIACMDEQLRPGFRPDLIALGLDIVRRNKLPEPSCLGDVLVAPVGELNDVQDFAFTLLGWSQRPIQNGVFLIGLARAFLDLEVWVAKHESLLGRREREALLEMTERKFAGFEKCFDEFRNDETRAREFVGGYEYGRTEIEKLLG